MMLLLMQEYIDVQLIFFEVHPTSCFSPTMITSDACVIIFYLIRNICLLLIRTTNYTHFIKFDTSNSGAPDGVTSSKYLVAPQCKLKSKFRQQCCWAVGTRFKIRNCIKSIHQYKSGYKEALRSSCQDTQRSCKMPNLSF